MPIDYNDPDEIVLGKDLKVGDCVRSRHWSDGRLPDHPAGRQTDSLQYAIHAPPPAYGRSCCHCV